VNVSSELQVNERVEKYLQQLPSRMFCLNNVLLLYLFLQHTVTRDDLNREWVHD